LTEDGDIVIESGDLLLRRGMDALADQIVFRLKTVKGDYELEPNCGASLESLVGMPNTEETGAEGRALVFDALTHDGLFNSSALDLDAVPLSEDEIALVVSLPWERKGLLITASVDLKEGDVVVTRR